MASGKTGGRWLARAAMGLAAGLAVVGVAMAATSADETAVTAALNASAEAWSRGDLDGFMQYYEPGEATVYLNKDGLVRGYKAIHDMYAGRFGQGGSMGQLSLELLNFRPLGPGYALATGRFHLARPAAEGGAATGLFTLVFHKSGGRWRIISDHTS
ncbi:MAG: nuclear transport factor 2 family protein [Caulobacteraceae bacterium]|nr:nuclear transport factor 2 family protein [Caulobacteraceae bacterium]